MKDIFYLIKSIFTRKSSQVNLLVDSGYAFDYLSILQVKMNKGGNNNYNNYFNCFDNLLNQIDSNLFFDILESQEYINLYKANLLVFELVDSAKKDLCRASRVDIANYSRYEAKMALQKKFFGEPLSEIKIGY